MESLPPCFEEEPVEDPQPAQAKKGWKFWKKDQPRTYTLFMMTYDPDKTCYRITESEVESIPYDAIRITGQKDQFLWYTGRWDIPPQNTKVTAMDLLKLLKNRDIQDAFDKLTGNQSFHEGLDVKKLIVYGIIGVVGLIVALIFAQPLLT